MENSISLENVGQYLQQTYGGRVLPILYIWGIKLLAVGQSSTITGTYAEQFIMGDFLNLRLKKWPRALITRSFAIVPTMIVALWFDTAEDSLIILNEWLNVLQSVQIPFALIPLFCLVSKEHIMGTFKIGTVFKVISWCVAALMTVINDSQLLEFFSSKVNGIIVGAIVCVVTATYAVFIIYLILRATTFSVVLDLAKANSVTANDILSLDS
ncbi:unnamed protein product [Lathyrus sativus]|nr:unnamed protein product [Lathyrus sativus]CAK8057012.1 unnamed protein product [Lathyrus sativus]